MADQEAIAKRAYELYLERGSTPGYEMEDWLQAEAELATAAAGEAKTKGKGKGETTVGEAAETPASRRAARRENAPAQSTGRRALRQ
jgi:hypothetical protein